MSVKIDIQRRASYIIAFFIILGISIAVWIFVVQKYYQTSAGLSEFLNSVFVKDKISQILLYTYIFLIITVLSRFFIFPFFRTLLLDDLSYSWQKRIKDLENILLSKYDFQDIQFERNRKDADKTNVDNLYHDQSQISVKNSTGHRALSAATEVEMFEVIEMRIDAEVQRLANFSRQNLMIGAFVTLVAIVWLIFSNLDGNYSSENQFIIQFLPRISFAVLLEIIAFFFLRLYVNTTKEIKYFQNEKTNIDFKRIALFKALETKNKDLITEILSKFADTERNFVISRGESVKPSQRSLNFKDISLGELLELISLQKPQQ